MHMQLTSGPLFSQEGLGPRLNKERLSSCKHLIPGVSIEKSIANGEIKWSWVFSDSALTVKEGSLQILPQGRGSIIGESL